MKKKKLLVIVSIILILVIASIVIVISVKMSESSNKNGGNNVGGDSEITQNLQVTGKLAEYIKGLANNYSIKYSGNFKNDGGEAVNTIVEYTQSENNYALKSADLDMHLIYDGTKLYSISQRYKMIVEISKESFDISEYNLVSDFGQTFVKSYEETLNNIKYDVEEYTYNEKVIKYYFNGDEVKLVNYDLQEIKVIRVEKNTNTLLLIKPEDYNLVRF